MTAFKVYAVDNGTRRPTYAFVNDEGTQFEGYSRRSDAEDVAARLAVKAGARQHQVTHDLDTDTWAVHTTEEVPTHFPWGVALLPAGTRISPAYPTRGEALAWARNHRVPV